MLNSFISWIAWVLGYVIAFAFTKIMALLVFVTTILTSTVLIPILVSLFWKGKKTQLAGVLSCAMGLVSVIVYYIGIQQLGITNDTYGTYIWSFSIVGVTFSLMKLTRKKRSGV